MLLRFTDNLIMQLTRGCNLECSYCFQGNKKGKNKRVTLEEFKNLVDTTLYERCVLGSRDNYIEFHFHGGEVTLLGSDLIIEMMEYLKMRSKYFRGIHISIQSNGILVDEKLARYLAENNISLGFSFDGIVSDRCSVETSKKLLENMKRFHKDFGLKIGTLTTLSSKNVKTWFTETIPLLMEFSDGFGFNIICTSPEDDDLIPDPKDLWEYVFLPILQTWLTDHPLRERALVRVIESVLEEIIFNTQHERTWKTGCFNQQCGHLSNMVAVDPDMVLTGCDKYLEEGKYIKEVRETFEFNKKDFLGVKQLTKVFDFVKDLNNKRKSRGCMECFAKESCPGECQSYCLSKYGEVKTPSDDWCLLYKNTVQFVIENWTKIIMNKCLTHDNLILGVKSDARLALDNENKELVINPNGTYGGKFKYDL